MTALLRSSAVTKIELSSSPANGPIQAKDPPLDFDPGTLSWVRREIDQALAEGLKSLAALSKPGGDAVALKAARMHVHQATGAIRMIGLDAVAEFSAEIERVLGGLEGLGAARVQATSPVVERACRKLSIFLGELASGAPPAALKLYPEYAAMRHARGAEASTPTDLFYPNLRMRIPRAVLREAIAEGKVPSHLAKKRRLYQSGLLLWLRGEASGARMMREAVAGIEAVTPHENMRAFWWTVRALLEAMAERGLDCTPEVKQIAVRIDLQIRRVLEGSVAVADRMRREVLYCVARSSPVGPTVHAVQRAFRLSSLVPAANGIDADFASIEPRLREGRERLANIKETWLNFASGRTETLSKLKQALAGVHTQATELRHASLTELTAALLEGLNRMPAGAIAEPLAMEFTTALLLAESAFENYANLSTEFPHQVRAMLERLDAAVSGRPVPEDVTALGNLGKRAQERMILSQVGHEIRVNLHRMEDVFDEFLRDEAKRPTLASLVKESRQIHGALRIMGLDDADRLLTLCDERIEKYSSPDAATPDDELDLLAESLCGLEFYFEALEQQRRGAERLIASLLARWRGETVPEPVEEDESLESAVASLRAELPRLVEAAHTNRSDPTAREALKTKLAHLKDDAELIGDEQLALQARAAIAEFERDGQDLAAAVQALAASSPDAPEIAQESPALPELEASKRDAGPLDIYLSEARKILAAIGGALGALVCNPDDRVSLDIVRLGFHTLKESSRMVGLNDLADLAEEVEATHNRLLEKAQPVSATVLAMIDTARSNFSDWIDALREKGQVEPDSAKLRAALGVVGSELSPTEKPVVHVLTMAPVEEPAKLTAPSPGSVLATPTPPTAPRFDAEVEKIQAKVAEPSGIRTSDPAGKKDIWSVALAQPTSSETLTGVRDEIDTELLGRFLQEASGHLSAAFEELQAWRQAPSDAAVAERLRGTLHAFKGGARMVGAMRLGHFLQSIESRLVASEHRTVPPELFDALNTDLDFVCNTLDELTAYQSDDVLVSQGSKSPAPEPTLRLASASPAADPAEAPIAIQVAPPTVARMRALEPTLDQLVGKIARLREQIRQIEAQAAVKLRSRITELQERSGEYGLSELTRVENLTQSLSEALDGFASAQESLLRHIDDSVATLSLQ